ncbi:MAG TPA: hypothetical protein VJ801_12615 [Polyangia bacterium]|jgi:hypothetical protein|nr:hypothetical protein [Polyangia bacterium]
MSVKIKITFDGTAEGLAQHRLELGAFASALACFVAGLRRTASGLLTEATENTRGPVARVAELRVFLESVEGNSLALNGSVEAPPLMPGQNAELLDSLPERATKRFVQDIEDESRGRLRSKHARKYLGALPPGVSTQQYQVSSGGVVVYDATIGKVDLPTEPKDLPAIIKTKGRVVGLTFEPLTEVRLDVADTRLTCSATDAQVEKAIALRGHDVFVVAVLDGTKGRLLWIGDPGDFPKMLTPDQRTDHVLTRWDKTLERLSR